MKNYNEVSKYNVEKSISNILSFKGFSPKQKEVMNKFNKHLLLAGGSLRTRKGYLQLFKLQTIALKKEYDKISKKDLEDYIISLNKDYKPKTIIERLKFIKLFFSWYYQKPKEELDLVKWIVIKKEKNYKLPEEILQPTEIKKLVQVANTLRDKAMIFSLYESGCRKGEFLGLKIKHVQLDDYGAVLIVNGKTGSRRIRIIDCVPDLINWLNSHPHRDNPESPLWITQGAWLGRAFGEDGLKRLLKTTAKRAEIKKKIYPHLFRHSRATELAKHLTEAEMRIIFGWSADSTMPKVYVHLSGKDVDNKLLAIKGLLKEKDKQKEEALKPITCPFCKHNNSGTNTFCANCSRPLNNETKIDLLKAKEIIISRAMDNQRAINKQLVREVLEEIGLI